jgi:hypothetical protein
VILVRGWLALVAWCVLAGGAFAQDASTLAGISVSGPLLQGELRGFADEGGIKLRDDKGERTLTPDELVVWGRFRESERGPLIVLSDGGTLVADLLGISREECRVDSRLLGELVLPRQAVRGVVLRVPADRLARDQLRARIASRREPQDWLLLANGDELTGQILGQRYDADERVELLSFTATGAEKSTELPLQRIAAMAFDSVLVDDLTPRGKYFLAGLRDGSLLRALSVAQRAGRWELALACGVKLRLEGESLNEDLVAWQPLGSKVTYLSDLRTTGYKHIPFLTVEWPYHNDRNCLGGQLRAGGAVYPKGLGMHSTSRLAYTFPAGARQFCAELALDAASGVRGSVVYRVFIAGEDGAWQPAYESSVVRGGESPLPIAVDLNGAQRLVLIVDFAERGDELDHANWLNARLVP